MSAESLRVLIADDHPLFRDGMRSLLESVPDAEVVGEATTGDEAVELTGLRPSPTSRAVAWVGVAAPVGG